MTDQNNKKIKEEVEYAHTDAPGAYSKKFVAFIDILGFREIVNKTSSNNSSIEESEKYKEIDDIRATLGLVNEHLTSMSFQWDLFAKNHHVENKNEPKVQYHQFSDSVFVIADDNTIDFSFLIYLVHGLLYRLIVNGFYARGGISFGELICDGTALFGPAIIKAYDIERKMAGESRVILSNEATEKYKVFIKKHNNDALSNKTIQTFLEDYLKQSSDGPYQLQEFAHFKDARWTELLKKFQGTEIKETFDRTLTMYTENPKVFNKIKKVAKRFNDAVTKIDPSFKVQLPE